MLSNAWAAEGALGEGQPGKMAAVVDQAVPLQTKIELLRQKVKYVFVIFHENESFDHYFGTYPGAIGLFEAPQGYTPANQTPSFFQRYLDTNLNVQTITPFLMPQAVRTTQAGAASAFRATRGPERCIASNRDSRWSDLIKSA